MTESSGDLAVVSRAGSLLGRRRVYGALAVVAYAATVGVWLLMVTDDGRSAGAATAELVLTFTNLTTLLVGVTATAIAADVRWRWLSLGHLTVAAMAIVTAVVNALLLDPGLPGGWWGVVDLIQHYLLPLALVAAWLGLGPRFAVSWSQWPKVLAVPFAWLVVVLVRGSITESYPYDFLDAGENGWPSVSLMVVAILVFMLGVAALLMAVDRKRGHTG